MNEQKELLKSLVSRWLIPIQGRNAQVALIQEMTRKLHIGPDRVSGFPTIQRVRDVIREELSCLLLTTVSVSNGDKITYRPRDQEYRGRKITTYGWGKMFDCIVVKVNKDSLALRFENITFSKVCPLHCVELLAQIGIHPDFDSLNVQAKALAK